MSKFESSVRRFIDSLESFAVIVNEHVEEWRCTLQGDWPDGFTLLNRYVRTDVEPKYIFND